MEEKLRILIAAFEAVPFIKTGGLGDVIGSLPSAIAEAGCDVRVILPKLWTILPEYREKMQHLTSFNVPLGWRNQYCGLEKIQLSGVTFYFVDNEYYFKRDKVYGYFDDGERMAYFSKAVLESIMYMEWFCPDVLHCNDWHTALIPVFLREQYMAHDKYKNIKTVLTIHNLKFQGQFSAEMTGNVLGLSGTPAESQLVFNNSLNFMAGGVIYSDAVTTVSSAYAEEICTPYYGEGMHMLFGECKHRLHGILNGIETGEYDPKKDMDLWENFDENSLHLKRKNKKQLQKMLNLPQNSDVPLIVFVSRMTEQKGLELLGHIMPRLTELDLQMAILGVGDKRYEDEFRYWAKLKPQKVATEIKFDTKLSRLFYACGDMLLLPSRFEPCGLSQMIAMRYGTVPIVRETGGLKDSVEPYNKFTDEGTGFSFANFSENELYGTICSAIELYRNEPQRFENLQRRGMKKDFSWGKSARKYCEVYKELTERR